MQRFIRVISFLVTVILRLPCSFCQSKCTKPTTLELPPEVNLIDYHFHTNHNFTKENAPTCRGSTLYRIPITFDRLTFSCISKYPTVWKFQTAPHDDVRLKDFQVQKRRIFTDFWDNSTYTFESNLTLNFKFHYSVPTLYCVKLGSNISTAIESRRTGDPFKILVEIGNQYDYVDESKATRLGINKYCNVTLQLNTEEHTFRCGNNSTPQFFNCNNSDECNSDDKYGTCNQTFKRTFLNESCIEYNCARLSPSFSPAVIACQDSYGNSIARRYLAYPSLNGSNTPIIRLGRDGEFVQETIKLERQNESKIYFGESHQFICTGVGSYYSFGFTVGLSQANLKDNVTILSANNDSKLSEEFDTNQQRYIVKTIIDFTRDLTNQATIWCFGPRWNYDDYINCTYDVTVHEPKPPIIVEYSYKENHFDDSIDPKEKRFYSFSCISYGEPVPTISWTWNNASLDKPFNQNIYNITDYNLNDSTVESVLFLSARTTNSHIITCVAENFVNTYMHNFKVSEIRSALPSMIGFSISAVVLVIIISVGGFFLTRRYYKKQFQLLSDEEIEEFENGHSNADNHALILPYAIDNEIPQDDITIYDNVVLGEGNFGVVYKGKYKSRDVAVKTIKKTAEVRYFKALLAEIKIMCYVENHRNLVNLVGACTRNIRKRELYLIIEFCGNGNLVKKLRQSRTCFINLFFPNKTTKDYQNMKIIDINFTNNSLDVLPNISTLNLVSWSYDIACAMEYLSNKKIIHSDLAARNVLLTDALVCKVCDFGLSKQLFEEYAIYVQRQECPLPLKWLSIESLMDFEFSIQSDIWSYGILLWEIFSLGQSPYPGIQWNFQSYILLKNGFRMGIPEFCNQSIYSIMRRCWDEKPDCRPSFSKLREFFSEWLTKLKSNSK